MGLSNDQGSSLVGSNVVSTDTIRFAHESISSVGSPTAGNFLDDAHFGIGVNALPEPTGLATAVVCGLGMIGYGLRRRKADPAR